VCLPETMAKRLRTPSSAKDSQIDLSMSSASTVSMAEQSDILLLFVSLVMEAKHSSAVGAWKHDSEHTRSIFNSFMTILGGRLLNITNAVSIKNM